MDTITPLLVQSDEDILGIVRQLRVAYALKRTLRYATKRDHTVHSESVAEHKFALMFLARYFLPLEDPHKHLNERKVDDLILFHDFGEIINGDIPFHMKTHEDEKRERRDARAVFASLPRSMQSLASGSWEEYEERASPEALFAYALDKLEPVFELFDSVNECSIRRLKLTKPVYLGKKLEATANFPTMQRFIWATTRDMERRDIFL